MYLIDYCLLFFTSIGAATLLPGGSEALLLYYTNEGLNTLTLLLTSSIGNTLGSVINFFLGKYLSSWAIRKNYLKLSYVKKSKNYFDKYGAFALLFSWLPILGDPITFCAGVLKYNFILFTLLVFIWFTISRVTQLI